MIGATASTFTGLAFMDGHEVPIYLLVDEQGAMMPDRIKQSARPVQPDPQSHGRSQGGGVDPNPLERIPPIVRKVLQAPGQPLEAETRAVMESRFGHDFSQVRVHADARAAESASTLEAEAYTFTRHIVFGPDAYAPRTAAGRQLLAHELAHVVQQGLAAGSPAGQQGDLLEADADRAAAVVSRGGRPGPPSASAPPQIQYQRRRARSRSASRREAASASGLMDLVEADPTAAQSVLALAAAFQELASALPSNHPDWVALDRLREQITRANNAYQQMDRAGFTGSGILRWVRVIESAQNAISSLFGLSPLGGSGHLRTLWRRVGDLLQETRHTRMVQEAQSAESREREAAQEGQASARSDPARAAANDLRRYVRRQRSSMRDDPSLHTGPILDLLRRRLGSDRAALRRFLDRLRVAEPQLHAAVSLEGHLARALGMRTSVDEAVDDLRAYVRRQGAAMTGEPDRHVSPVMGILVSHLGWNPTVIRQFLDGLQNADPGLFRAVALDGRTLNAFLERERPVLPSVGRALLHGVMGEWHEGSVREGMSEVEREEAEAEDLSSIAVDTVIGLVPGLDQASDARDLMAHTYLLITREGELRSPLRWVSLVFSLIGAIPEVGTAIKSLSKVLMRGLARHGYHLVARALNLIERVLPGALDELEHMRAFYRAGWSRFAIRAGEIWTDFFNRGQVVFRGLLNATAERLGRIRGYASRMMPDAFVRARAIFEEAFDAILSRVTRIGSGIAASIPRLLNGLRERVMHLSATGRLQLEVERLEGLESAARRALERGDPATAQRLLAELEELVTGVERRVDDLAGGPASAAGRSPGAPPRRSVESPPPAPARPPDMEGASTRLETAAPPRHADPGIAEWPDGLVHYGLDESQARASYRASLQADPTREAGIWVDLDTGEQIVVQGNQRFVTSEWYQDPEFASRRWRAVEHFHPGSDIGARFASPSDFEHMLYNQLHGIEPPGPVTTHIRWRDPATRRLVTTDIGFDPALPQPYWIGYRDASGDWQVEFFADVPWNPGSDYQAFMRTQGIPVGSLPARTPAGTAPHQMSPQPLSPGSSGLAPEEAVPASSIDQLVAEAGHTPIPEHAAPVGGATPLEEVFPEESLARILGAGSHSGPPAQSPGLDQLVAEAGHTPIPEHGAPVGGATALEEVFPEESLARILGAGPHSGPPAQSPGLDQLVAEAGHTPIPEHAAPVGGATPLEEVFPEERLRSILGAPPAPGTGVHLPASETQDEVSQAFDWMADQPQPAAPVSAGATVQAPEVAAGFAQQHLALLGSLLARPLTGSEIAVLGQVWSSVANPGDLARLAAGNSRRLFNNHRNRFWRAVRQDPAARQLLTDAGFSFGPGLTSAPTYLLPNGNRVQVTIDHIVERQTDPGRALDPGNLRLSFRRENTVVLRLLHQLDPFQRHP